MKAAIWVWVYPLVRGGKDGGLEGYDLPTRTLCSNSVYNHMPFLYAMKPLFNGDSWELMKPVSETNPKRKALESLQEFIARRKQPLEEAQSLEAELQLFL